MQLEGVYSVLPTPFTATGDVDDDSLRRVVDLFIGAGVNGVTVLGVTGEVARLDDRERLRVLETVASHVNGRIGVVAGTTAEGTRTCIGYSRAAKAAGATAVMNPDLVNDFCLRVVFADGRTVHLLQWNWHERLGEYNLPLTPEVPEVPPVKRRGRLSYAVSRGRLQCTQ